MTSTDSFFNLMKVYLNYQVYEMVCRELNKFPISWLEFCDYAYKKERIKI